MATINKALTTYLPPQSVEWLGVYCLDKKHLVNKDGNPKLGTAVADIIARLAGGELTLPAPIEQSSTVPNTLQYGNSTEIIELKSEVNELKKLVDKVLCSTVPSTVPDYIGLGEVRLEIEKALEPINEAIEALKSEMAPQEHTKSESIVPDRIDTNQTNTVYPIGMMKDDRPFYDALIGKPELLLQVIEILKASPNNTDLSNLLFEIGIFRKDGKPFGTDRVGRIKRIAKQLNDVGGEIIE